VYIYLFIYLFYIIIDKLLVFMYYLVCLLITFLRGQFLHLHMTCAKNTYRNPYESWRRHCDLVES